jgi:hypothetical protein
MMLKSCDGALAWADTHIVPTSHDTFAYEQGEWTQQRLMVSPGETKRARRATLPRRHVRRRRVVMYTVGHPWRLGLPRVAGGELGPAVRARSEDAPHRRR